MGWRQSWHLNMESCNIVRSRSLSPYLKQSGCSMRSPINVISAVSCWKGWPQWLHFWEACTAHIAHNIVILTKSLPLVSNLLKASVIMTSAADNVTILIQKIFRLNVAATELTLETLRVIQLLTGMRNAGIYLFPQYIWKIYFPCSKVLVCDRFTASITQKFFLYLLWNLPSSALKILSSRIWWTVFVPICSFQL